MGERRVEAWERHTEWPLTIAAAIFLSAYAWPILDNSLDQPGRITCDIVTLVVWIAFGIDYATRIVLAHHRWNYWWHHLPDLAVVALPVLRPLRLLRLVMLLRVINRNATDNLRGRIATYVSAATVLLLLCSSLAVLDAEHHARNANIHTFGDALWWSATTVSTVGYGDRYPTTGEGRAIAVGLMLGGIALLGIVTAAIATWMIERVREVEESTQGATRADIAALSAQITDLKRTITELRSDTSRTRAPEYPVAPIVDLSVGRLV